MPKSRKDEIASVFLPRRSQRESERQAPAPAAPLDQYPPQLVPDPCIYCESRAHHSWNCPQWEDKVVARRKQECELCRTTDTIHLHHVIRIQAGKAIDFQ